MALFTQASPCMPIIPRFKRIFGREAADAEQRHGHGIISGANELLKGFHRTGNDYAVPGKNQRALRGIQ